MQIAHINSNGLNQIAEALGKFHKLGREHFNESMVAAWATIAEDHYNNGNEVYFEIQSFDSNTGRPEEIVISEDGYEIELINVE